MNKIIASSHIVSPNVETVFATLDQIYDYVIVIVDGQNDQNAMDSRWKLYAISGASETLVAEGTLGVINTPQVVLSNVQSGSILELRGESTRAATSGAVKGMIVGYSS